MTGYVPATGQLFLDIDHDVHMVSANGEKERQFLLLSGMISSAYEGIVLEQFTGIPSVSTMSLLAQAAEQDIGIEILTVADYEEKKAGLALPDSTLAAMEQEIAAGKIVIVPREEQRLMEWQGSGYIVLDRETLAGSYMIEGGLNGGNCGIEVGLMYLSNLILTASDVYELVSLMAGVIQLFSSMALLTPGAVVLGMLGLMAITLVISAMMIAVIDSYLEVGYLIDMYVDGNEAAGEAAKDILVINGIWAVGSWGASGMVRYCSNRAAAGWLKETMGYSSAPRLINALGGDAKTATKVCQSLKRAGFGSEAIADMAERLGREGTLKLERLASGGLSGDILEGLARNEDLLGRYSADTLLSFKGTACAADTVIDFLRQTDVDGASLYRIYGDKAVDIWKTMDKKGLESLWNYGDEFLEQYQRRGSEFVQDFLENGDAALRGGLKVGMNFDEVSGYLKGLDFQNMNVADLNRYLNNVEKIDLGNMDVAKLQTQILQDAGFTNFDIKGNLADITAFKSGTIRVEEIDADLVLYRRGYPTEGTGGYGYGQWWSDSRLSIEDAREQLAILENWGNPLTGEYEMTVPQGTKAITGIAEEQSFYDDITGELLEHRGGGAKQYWFNSIDASWIK